jgi:hypothetical protein
MTGLPLLVARQSLLDAAVLLGLGGVLLLAVSWVEGGAGKSLGLLATLGPIALGAGTAHRLARARAAGVVDGWEALGHAPHKLLAPLLGVAVALAVLCLVMPVATAAVPLPPPVDPALGAWWSSGWQGLPARVWGVPPGDLGLVDLITRWRQQAPPGARAGVDGGELIRRTSLALAWPIAVIAGSRGALGSGRVGSPARGALWATAATAGWLLVGALAVGAYSMM